MVTQIQHTPTKLEWAKIDGGFHFAYHPRIDERAEEAPAGPCVGKRRRTKSPTDQLKFDTETRQLLPANAPEEVANFTTDLK
jgi:hypothetical protein